MYLKITMTVYICKKVSHYQESSFNRIKTRQYSYIFSPTSVKNEHKNIMSLYKIFYE